MAAPCILHDERLNLSALVTDNADVLLRRMMGRDPSSQVASSAHIELYPQYFFPGTNLFGESRARITVDVFGDFHQVATGSSQGDYA